MLRIREFSHQVKMMFKEHEEGLISNQLVQERLSLAALWLHATSCALARFDANLRNGLEGRALEHESAVVAHLCAHANGEFSAALRSLRANHDEITRKAGTSVLQWIDGFSNDHYSLPEKSRNADARGRDGHGYHADQEQIQQFGGGTVFEGQAV